MLGERSPSGECCFNRRHSSSSFPRLTLNFRVQDTILSFYDIVQIGETGLARKVEATYP